ncbi:MAG TPA: galactose/glucose ABC transporter substrate-binding protein MglB [Anaerolineaceae bacterium]|nr:galactose/glucose ABC transporter substrate-binding protein MglB [Anaerolineaceae bacterium]HPN52413.1 galactose/glucose ABC transporter substrate-binding protein MglB [Anaerolineaceae bacterium]
MHKSRSIMVLLSLLVVVSIILTACAQPTAAATKAADKPAETAKELTAGVAIYKFDDTFMTAVRNTISKEAEGKIKVELVDSQNAQATQNDQVDLFLTKGVTVMAINPVDRTAAGVIIDKAKAKNIPVVFFNREPMQEDMAKWDKVYYVGAKAEESGTFEGQILVDYWKSHPEMDKNKDGVMQYVMLKGEPGHQDAELRTKYSIKAIEDAGIKVEKLAEDTGMWDRVKGQEKMSAFIAANGDKIEAVLANNDDMALGAIEALKAAGYFGADKKFMPVVGVDATAPALEALKAGTLLGTVLNDAKNQGKATLMLAYVLAKGETPTKENTGYTITDGKYIWVAYKMILLNNIADAQ